MSLFKSIGKALKKVVKVAAPVAVGFLGGGPVGAIAGGLSSLTQASYQARVPGPILTPPVVVPRLPAPRPGVPAPRGPGGGPMATGRIRGPMAPTGPRPSNGHKWGWVPWLERWLPRVGRRVAEQAGYVILSGIGWALVNNVWSPEVVVRKRATMNPCNPKALRRAVRRVKGATRLCREVERLTSTGRRRSRGGRSCAPSITQVK